MQALAGLCCADGALLCSAPTDARQALASLFCTHGALLRSAPTDGRQALGGPWCAHGALLRVASLSREKSRNLQNELSYLHIFTILQDFYGQR